MGCAASEVLGLRWSHLNADALRVRRGRVAVSADSEEGLPKSRRSSRDLPLPPELTEVLRTLKTRQKAEALALDATWSDDRLIAVHEDGMPVPHEWYSDEFQRLRERAGLRRIHLKGLRNTVTSTGTARMPRRAPRSMLCRPRSDCNLLASARPPELVGINRRGTAPNSTDLQ